MSNPSRLTLAALWLAIPTILVFVDVGTQAEYQGDLWTHLRQGQVIAEHGGVPKTDTITYTIHGQPVYNQNWLGQIILYQAYLLDGIRSSQMLAVLLYSTMIALVTWNCYSRSGNARAAAAAALIAAACAWTNLSVRTQTFGIFCFAVVSTTYWMWPRKSWWPLAIIALTQIFWTNVHGTFPLGIVLPLVFAFGRGLDALSKDGLKAALQDELVIRCLVAAGVAFASSFVCPAPEMTMSYITQNVSRSTARGVMEWDAPTLGDFTGKLFFASVIITMLMLNFSGRKLTWLETVVVVVFFLLGEKAVRMVIWWGLMVAPVLAVQFAGYAERAKAEREAARATKPDLPPEQPDQESPALNWIFAIAMALFVVFSTPWTKQHNPMVIEARKLTIFQDEPADAVRALKDLGATGNLYTSLEWGAYISYHIPQIYVTIDARVDMFSDEIWGEVATVSGAIPGWEEVLKNDHVNYILWPPRAGKLLIRAAEKSPNWRKVPTKDNCVLFERVEKLPDLPPDEIAARKAKEKNQHAAEEAAAKTGVSTLQDPATRQ